MSSPTESLSDATANTEGLAFSSSRKRNDRARAYGAACESCRHRKIRCGLQHPSCANCIRYKQVCRYHHRRESASLPSAGHRTRTVVSTNSTATALQRRVTELERELAAAKSQQESATAGDHNRTGPSRATNHGVEDGHYDLFEGPNGLEERRHFFTATLHIARSFESMASSRLNSDDYGISSHLAADLIKAYFVWWNGLHCYLYKTDFYCSLVLEGPKASPFLLNAVFSQGSRLLSSGMYSFQQGQGQGHLPHSDYFLQRAKSRLVDEIDCGSSPALLQGLLIMAGREASCGHVDQAWLYTGMAIRVLRSLGLDSPRMDQRSGEYRPIGFQKRELHHRLFWTVYCWDKTLSLTLGRQSTFSAPPHVSSEIMVDEADDEQPWDPGQVTMVTVGLSRSVRVSSSSSSTISVFRCFARLCMIIEDMLKARYGTDSVTDEQVAQLAARLDAWQAAGPSSFIVSPDDPCPSPQMLQLNILYHCCYIFLYRPSISLSGPVQDVAMSLCRHHATKIHDLIRMRERDIGLQNLSYLVCHCLYAAVTINVYDFRNGTRDDSAAAAIQLGHGIRVLEFCSWLSPGMQKAVMTMKLHLSHPVGLVSGTDVHGSLQTDEQNRNSASLLPASYATQGGASSLSPSASAQQPPLQTSLSSSEVQPTWPIFLPSPPFGNRADGTSTSAVYQSSQLGFAAVPTTWDQAISEHSLRDLGEIWDHEILPDFPDTLTRPIV